MRLLLILTAFLTALAGQQAAARAEPAHACAVAAVAGTESKQRAVLQAFPAQKIAPLDCVNFALPARHGGVVQTAPLYRDRLLI